MKGTLVIGGREFKVLPASVKDYKAISLASKTWDTETAALAKAAESADEVAADQHLAAAHGALVGVLHSVVVKAQPELTREEIEDLVPADPVVAVRLFMALGRAAGLVEDVAERDPGEAGSQ